MMGVPGLTTALLPYYSEIHLGCHSPECRRQRQVAVALGESGCPSTRPMIIDGPSLVHYVYRNIPVPEPQQAEVPKGVGCLFPKLSYGDVAEGVVAFLDRLREWGVEISAIYFDAVLPVQKRSERLQRLTGAARLLENLKQKHPQGFAAPTNQAASVTGPPDVTSLLHPGPVSLPSAARGGWPPTPFVVVAVLDKLQRSSTYRSVTHTVPGEADRFCAAQAREYDGALVLSSDSDFFLYDLGLNGAFIHLAGLSLCNCSKCGGQLTGLCVRAWHRLEIERRLNTPSLLRVAFSMPLCQKPCLAEAVQLSKEELDHKSEESFKKFQQSYKTKGLFERCRDMPELHELDTRVAEFVMQVECPDFESRMDTDAVVQDQPRGAVPPPEQKTAEEDDGDEPREELANDTIDLRSQNQASDIHMYLPMLHEDPGRASAWKVGQDLRDLGYSTSVRTRRKQTVPPKQADPLATSDPDAECQSMPSVPSMYEYHRSGPARVAARLVVHSSLCSLEKQAVGFCTSTNEARSVFRQITRSEADLWRLVALYMVCKWYRESGKQHPSQAAMVRALLGPERLVEPMAIWTWHDIHLAAQLEAALCSLRITRQLLDRAHVRDGSLGQLRGILSSDMPGFLELEGWGMDAAVAERGVGQVLELTDGDDEKGEEEDEGKEEGEGEEEEDEEEWESGHREGISQPSMSQMDGGNGWDRERAEYTASEQDFAAERVTEKYV